MEFDKEDRKTTTIFSFEVQKPANCKNFCLKISVSILLFWYILFPADCSIVVESAASSRLK